MLLSLFFYIDIAAVVPFYVEQIVAPLDFSNDDTWAVGGGGEDEGNTILKLLKLLRIIRIFKVTRTYPGAAANPNANPNQNPNPNPNRNRDRNRKPNRNTTPNQVRRCSAGLSSHRHRRSSCRSPSLYSARPSSVRSTFSSR